MVAIFSAPKLVDSFSRESGIGKKKVRARVQPNPRGELVPSFSFAATCEPPTRSCHISWSQLSQIRYSSFYYILYDRPRFVTVSHSRDLQAPFTYWNVAPFAPGSSHTYRTFWNFLQLSRTTLRPLRTDALDPTSSRALCLAEWALILYYTNFLQIQMANI